MATANKGGRPATYQDVLDAPHHMVAEILDRILYTQWRSPIRHALAVARLAVELGNAFDRGCPDGWWIFREPELHLGADIVVPNLTGWSRTKMPDFPDGAYFAIAPDWACEFLRRRPAASINVKNVPSMPTKAYRISGSSIPRSKCWKFSSCTTGSGYCWTRLSMTHW